jgi:DNA/RNA endonuclease YhcR with UshA esterase domain
MKICWPVLAFLILALNLPADETNSTALMKIGTQDVTNYFNKEIIVTGKVAQVSIRPGIVFLNMDKPYPDSPFTLVIFPAATNQFGNLKALRGASVEVTGLITNYHDKAEIVLKKANQLKVTSPAPAHAPAMSH